MYARSVTVSSGVAEPACPDALPSVRGARQSQARGRRQLAPGELRVERRSVDTIEQATWDRLAARNPWATPFSSWAFQRAWWDAYGPNAHDETLAIRDHGTSDDGLVAILPLMRRHAMEPSDDVTRSQLRHGSAANLTSVPPAAVALYMGASYHADYATILAAPEDLPDVCRAVVEHLAGAAKGAWDVIDLRRWRCGDPAAAALAAALGAREMAHGWTLNLEREDVCPVATILDGADFDGFLATLDKKDRHEIRRKLRRAEGTGEVRLNVSTQPLAELDQFVDLHQARWGDQGLFPATPGGEQSRRFVRGLFERFGPAGPAKLTFLSVGAQRIGAGIHFETADSLLYYNAGVDPNAMHLSPGVLLVAGYVQLAIACGRRRVDFLRGDEPYKYQWAAVDEPIHRLLVRRPGLA